MTTTNRKARHTDTDPGLHVTPSSTAEPNLKHQLCNTASDKERCEAFLDRLTEASVNIDRRA
ncbi:hypothetical protein GC176_02030 [bacterium]|nr:hypothetical protein [bacterium]